MNLKNPLTAILIFVGFWTIITLLIIYIFVPIFGGSKRVSDEYPDYESECVPNYMGGCDPI